MKRFLLMVTMACILTSCSPSNVDDVNKNINENLIPTPNLLMSKTISMNNKEHYAYIVDKNTGVVYLGYAGVYRHDLTVMLNADGTPVTAEQLGIKY
jgi:hypothetical protein